MSQDGPKWTSWFKLLNTKDMPKYQIGTSNSKHKLLNEYKEDENS